MNKIKLDTLLNEALQQLYKKRDSSSETIIDEIILDYEKVLELVKHDKLTKSDLLYMFSYTRKYVETSSNYKQDFLEAMYQVEVYLKSIRDELIN